MKTGGPERVNMRVWWSFTVIFSMILSDMAGIVASSGSDVDPNGYIVYCPCMGRFGNQADQFLGSLAFAKAVNRTLILPPWVEYRRMHRNAVMEPFDSYFQVGPLQEYHRVTTMETFMQDLADTVWPPEKRKSFCYMARHGKDKGAECNAKDGNPFGPFWDWFNIDFRGSVLYEPLFYDTHRPKEMEEWRRRFPSSEYPVWAFVGPPAAFPVTSANAKLQRYVKWSETYAEQASAFIKKNIPEGPFVGIHLRNGPDFERACEHVTTSPNMFAAKQCVGERGQYGPTTHEMCFPSAKTITEQVKKEVLRIGASAVFIATDFKDLRDELSKALPEVKLVKQDEPASPMLDLSILGRADHFIGNCISTFTAFVKRERDVSSLPSSFWAFEKKVKEEL
ncbi:GDP-fucose protein O-fucosyltransferase 1 [Aplysia californica]|uniref:GDP-fucose protein O-fucosyltransferase 1 n=1 Tax=Aplysia californica TaxID=6500 RepID=A0ABM0K3E9_APLCA|nr:GDP-fucose protein O-fucosyltransferase 1 [Aplysia californica]